jgi:hypothetical protein
MNELYVLKSTNYEDKSIQTCSYMIKERVTRINADESELNMSKICRINAFMQYVNGVRLVATASNYCTVYVNSARPIIRQLGTHSTVLVTFNYFLSSNLLCVAFSSSNKTSYFSCTSSYKASRSNRSTFIFVKIIEHLQSMQLSDRCFFV